MGVVGVFPYLEEKGLETPSVDMTLVRRVEVDLLSLYFAYIRVTHKWISYKALREVALPTPVLTPIETILSRLVAALHKKLLQTFTQDTETIIHIDGLPTVQKTKAREARMTQNSKHMVALNDVSTKILEITSPACDTLNQRTRRRRLLRLSQKAKESWSSARTIDSATRDSLAIGLKNLGWEVCHCQGETDVCIGRKAERHHGQIVAASADSDLLIHGLDTLLRKDTRSHAFTEYKIEHVIQKCQVGPQWIVAGIVSNNDYSSHLPGQSLAKNVAAVMECDAVSERSVLDQYCTMKDVSSVVFQPAMDIFFDKQEILEAESTSNGTIDATMERIVNSVSRDLRESKVTDKSTTTSAHSLASQEIIASEEVMANGGSIIDEENTVSLEASQIDIKNKAKKCFLTSGNKFVAKQFTTPVFNTDTNNSIESVSRKGKRRTANTINKGGPNKKRKERVKLQAKKPPRQKVQRNKASKMVRQLAQQPSQQLAQQHTQQVDGDQTEDVIVSPKTGRKRNVGNMVGDVLDRNYKMATLNIGTIESCFEQGLKNNYGVAKCNSVNGSIQLTIQNLVKLNTDLTRCGIMATFNYIKRYHGRSFNRTWIYRHREPKKLQYISENRHGYFKTLAKGLYKEDIKGKGESFDAALETIMRFKAMPGFEKGMLREVMDYGSASSRFMDQIGQTLGDMVRCHIRVFVSELKKRIEIWNQEWAASQEGLAFLDSIDDTGKSLDHDAVSVFWVLDTKLPSSKRFAYLPMPAFKDNYCLVSEMHLLETILRRDNLDRERLVDIFGKMGDTTEMSQSHPGELHRKLFFNGRKTNYNRHACVACPDDKSLSHLLDLETLPCKDELNALDIENASSSEYKNAKEMVKNTITDKIVGMDSKTRPGKYALAGSLLTDGHQLKIHVYNLTHPKKKGENEHIGGAPHSVKSPQPASQQGQNPTNTYSTKSKMKYLPDLIQHLDALREEFGDQTSHVVVAIDPGIKSTAAAVVVDSLVLEKSWNLSFSKGCHEWNSQRHSRILRHHKKTKQFNTEEGMMSVNDLEAKIRPVLCIDPRGASLGEQFRNLEGSYKVHLESVFAVEKYLRTFYGSKGFKIACYRKEQGEKAEVGRAISGILKVARLRAQANKKDRRK
ncbi:hypothetical protein BGX20_001442, partial [Mortierella sp. AD010]